MELFRGFIHDEDDHQEHGEGKHHHSHHHHSHHHSNHQNHLHEPTGVFNEFNNNKTQLNCGEYDQYDQSGTANCHLPPPPPQTGADIYHAEEYLHNNELESPVPKYKADYKTE